MPGSLALAENSNLGTCLMLLLLPTPLEYWIQMAVLLRQPQQLQLHMVALVDACAQVVGVGGGMRSVRHREGQTCERVGCGFGGTQQDRSRAVRLAA